MPAMRPGDTTQLPRRFYLRPFDKYAEADTFGDFRETGHVGLFIRYTEEGGNPFKFGSWIKAVYDLCGRKRKVFDISQTISSSSEKGSNADNS